MTSSDKSSGWFFTLLKKGKQFWNYVWNGTSSTSWILAILLAFILVRFIIYPLVGLIAGTNLPLVAVISGSMEHEGTFDEWWNSPAVCNNITTCSQEEWYAKKNISQKNFSSFTLPNGFNKGDLILLHGKKPERISVGDVLVFNAKTPYPVIHRVVQKKPITHEQTNQTTYLFQTKGDHNWYQIQHDYVDETTINSSQILGVAYARVPWFGWLKIWASQGISSVASVIESS
ncbi:MAG: signal peptidase I [Candidatus Nanoarchaeia archaeon]